MFSEYPNFNLLAQKMNCSLDKSPQGPVSNLVDFFFNGGVCEQKHDMKMATKIEVARNNSLAPSTTTNSTASFFGSLCSNLHCQMMLNSIVPQKKFLKDIPPFNARGSLMTLLDNHFSVVGQLGDASTINTKLKDILKPFIPNNSLTNIFNVDFEKWPHLVPDREEKNTSHQENLSSMQDFLIRKKTPSEELLKPAEVMEVDEEDDIIFDHDISMDLSSCDDNDADEEDDDDNDDEDSDGDDSEVIDFSDWDEVDDKYSPCSKVLPSNESKPPFTLDNVMLKWDPGIDEEIKNLPKTSKVSYKSWLDSSDDEDSTMLFEANRKWNKFYCSHSKRKDKTRIITKKVAFCIFNSTVIVKIMSLHMYVSLGCV